MFRLHTPEPQLRQQRQQRWETNSKLSIGVCRFRLLLHNDHAANVYVAHVVGLLQVVCKCTKLQTAIFCSVGFGTWLPCLACIERVKSFRKALHVSICGRDCRSEVYCQFELEFLFSTLLRMILSGYAWSLKTKKRDVFATPHPS